MGIFAAEYYLAVSILAKRSVTKVDAAIVQSARLRDVGVANRKKNLHAEKEKPKNFPLKERFLGLDDIHVIEFVKGTLTSSTYFILLMLSRKFDCGVHTCQKWCHPPSHKPAPCPRSSAKVTHCPCGKSSIAPSLNSDFSNYTFPARASCVSSIPTCNNVCDKSHARCGHPCRAQCHTGPCPPCSVELTRPCRCGVSTKSIHCHELFKEDTIEEVEILCNRPCMALRACGRHECRRPCCPLASLASIGGKKGKKRAVEEPISGIGEERGGWHECDLVCRKMLSCGNHRCEERDHKGACPPCLRSSFEEVLSYFLLFLGLSSFVCKMVCFCGRTVYDPPIPCGAVMHCSYSCSRPSPPCGHPRTPHVCHEDPSSCPPCVHLTTKQCACGKKAMQNIRCSLENEKISCGTTCEKLLDCGFHRCKRSCHPGECGKCTTTCGKLRKSWYVSRRGCQDLISHRAAVSRIITLAHCPAMHPRAVSKLNHAKRWSP